MQKVMTSVLFLLLSTAMLWGQSAITVAGGDISGNSGKVRQSIGQLLVMGQSNSSGRMFEGVQRPIAAITSVGDTTVCSLSPLPAYEANASGGDWNVQSSISSTISQSGSVTLGSNTGSAIEIDTIVYTFNGYDDFAYVKSRPIPTLACTNLSLQTDADGEVHIDNTVIGQGAQSASTGIMIAASDSVLACTNGLQQQITFTGMDSTGCADSCTASITLLDTIRPVTACTEAENLVLVWQGLSLYPSSLAGNSTDNCSGQNLEFSFTSDFKEKSFTLNCREQLRLVDTLDIYMRDESGNVSSCEVGVNFDYAAGEDCGCDWGSLKLKGEIAPNDYKAKESIVATGKVTLGDTVSVKAEQIIVLGPGFRVAKGNTFFARIDSCGDVQQPLTYFPEKDLKQEDDHVLRGSEDRGEGDMHIYAIQAFPNPFSDWFKVQFDLQTAGTVSFELHNLQGGLQFRLLDDVYFESGLQEMMIDGSRLAPGMYVLTALVNGKVVSKQISKI